MEIPMHHGGPVVTYTPKAQMSLRRSSCGRPATRSGLRYSGVPHVSLVMKLVPRQGWCIVEKPKSAGVGSGIGQTSSLPSDSASAALTYQQSPACRPSLHR